MSARAITLPHVSGSGAGNWLQHDAGPWLLSAGKWIVAAEVNTITAVASHHVPKDPVQSLVAILLIVAVIGVAFNRVTSKKAKT